MTYRFGDVHITRFIRVGIIDELKISPKYRGYLVEKLGVPRTTIYNNLQALMSLGIVCKYTRNNNDRGRPKVYFSLTSVAKASLHDTIF